MTIGRDQAQRLAQEELRNSIYRKNQPSLLSRFVQRVSDWLQNVLGFHPGSNVGHGKASTGTGWLAIVAILVIILLVILFIWWRAGRLRGNPNTREALLEERISRPDEHREAAEAFAAAGDWPNAVRERLRAIARDLEERVIVEPRPGRTADELGTEAAAALPEHASALAVAVRTFDDVSYGDRPGTAESYRQVADTDEAIRRARPRPMATAERS